MIAFEDVVLRYPGADRDAVAAVSFEALRGRITAVVGPNGSGKSTLVRALLRRLAPARGRVTLDGADIRGFTLPRFARRVSVVPQREELAFPLTVREYVALGRFPHVGDWGGLGAEDAAALAVALDETGTRDLEGRTVDGLSGGEWQRVRIARCLAQGGEALVLDEPTTFLDVAHQMIVFELLDRLARGGRAILLVSHELNLVARFAGHMILLHRGSIAAAGDPAAVMRASVLERAYEWPVVVTRDPAVGAPALLPLRAAAGHQAPPWPE